jgi:hypothetical protein
MAAARLRALAARAFTHFTATGTASKIDPGQPKRTAA